MFLIGIFVFSASAVYQPEQITPCAVTNLALRQDGLELASPKEHEAYLFSMMLWIILKRWQMH